MDNQARLYSSRAIRIAIFTVLLLALPLVTSFASKPSQVTPHPIGYSRTASQLIARNLVVSSTVALTTSITEARALYASSTTNVLHPEVRTSLQASIASAQTLKASLTSQLIVDTISIRPVDFSPLEIDNLSLVQSNLISAVAAVKADQQALIQYKAALAEAARVKALAATGYHVNVWTAGFQDQIDACHGGVELTAHYGRKTIGEHWTCGGSSFPTRAGAIVTITGLDAGTYQVIGLVATLNAFTQGADLIPSGYDLLYQTCRNNQAVTTEFTALKKIG
jgi:hypothetical protein